jgi:hypothetical protein
VRSLFDIAEQKEEFDDSREDHQQTPDYSPVVDQEEKSGTYQSAHREEDLNNDGISLSFLVVEGLAEEEEGDVVGRVASESAEEEPDRDQNDVAIKDHNDGTHSAYTPRNEQCQLATIIINQKADDQKSKCGSKIGASGSNHAWQRILTLIVVQRGNIFKIIMIFRHVVTPFLFWQ